MGKKLPVSYQLEKRTKKKKQPTLKVEEFAAEYNILLKQPDKNIDFSDIPELDFDQLGKPVVGKFYHPIKQPISIRMDTDILEWFKQYPQYQKLINKACRFYMYVNMQRQRKKRQPILEKKTKKN